MEEHTLEHHGIYGQKWGIRRFQNPDGSLTPAGRKRYGVGEKGTIDDISTAKGIQKRLTDVEKANSFNRRYARRPLSTKKQKQKYSEQYQNGVREVRRLLDKARTENYDVYIRTGKKDTTSGKEFIETLGAGVLAGSVTNLMFGPIAGTAVGISSTAGLMGANKALNTQMFTKYKVKSTKDSNDESDGKDDKYVQLEAEEKKVFGKSSNSNNQNATNEPTTKNVQNTQNTQNAQNTQNKQPEYSQQNSSDLLKIAQTSGLSMLTDREVDAVNKRLQLEQTYKNLTKTTKKTPAQKIQEKITAFNKNYKTYADLIDNLNRMAGKTKDDKNKKGGNKKADSSKSTNDKPKKNSNVDTMNEIINATNMVLNSKRSKSTNPISKYAKMKVS